MMSPSVSASALLRFVLWGGEWGAHGADSQAVGSGDGGGRDVGCAAGAAQRSYERPYVFKRLAPVAKRLLVFVKNPSVLNVNSV